MVNTSKQYNACLRNGAMLQLEHVSKYCLYPKRNVSDQKTIYTPPTIAAEERSHGEHFSSPKIELLWAHFHYFPAPEN